DEGGDRHLVTFDLRVAKIDVGVSERNHERRLTGDPPSPLPFDVAEGDPGEPRRSAAWCGRGRGGRRREVCRDPLQLPACPRRVRRLDPLRELLEREPSLARLRAQELDRSLTLGIGCTKCGRVGAHVKGSLYCDSTSLASSSTAGGACCIATANGELPESPSACSRRRVAAPTSSRYCGVASRGG